jgi:vacuolar-type H+-ATPase subunit I/STV1
MEERSKALIGFGIILLIIGLIASFYYESISVGIKTYPYQNVGIVLDVAGIVLVALGLLFPSRWLE